MYIQYAMYSNMMYLHMMHVCASLHITFMCILDILSVLLKTKNKAYFHIILLPENIMLILSILCHRLDFDCRCSYSSIKQYDHTV